jgi:hypothetical protein
MEKCYEKRSDKNTHDHDRIMLCIMANVQPPIAPIAPPIAPPVFTVRDAMIVCGVNNINLFDGDTPAQRIATDLFGDDFATCMDKGLTELDYEFKT